MHHFQRDRFVNKRAPVEEYQRFGVRGTVQISAKEDKSWRIPLETGHLVGSVLRWWALGDAHGIAELLSAVHYLGKKRGDGLGRVQRWTVEPCTPWDGFPVVRAGRPLRSLPPNYPGLEDPDLAYGRLTPPYWDTSVSGLVAVPRAE